MSISTNSDTFGAASTWQQCQCIRSTFLIASLHQHLIKQKIMGCSRVCHAAAGVQFKGSSLNPAMRLWDLMELPSSEGFRSDISHLFELLPESMPCSWSAPILSSFCCWVCSQSQSVLLLHVVLLRRHADFSKGSMKFESMFIMSLTVSLRCKGSHT